jgi:type I restriction enzyme M protein
MSEELLQRNLLKSPEKIGVWDFYNIGATTVKALKEHGIIRSVEYGDVEKKKVDGIIVQQKKVVAVIEYKKPSEFKTKTQQDKAVKQELEVAKKLESKILIATDTKDTVWVNVLTGKRVCDEHGKEIKVNFDPKDEKVVALIEKINYSINEVNNNLKPKQLVNPTNLAKQIWQDIWSVSGATPENCLYTFVELFIFKYLSDLGVLKGRHNFHKLLEDFKDNDAEELLEDYAKSIRPKIKDLFPENPIDKTTIINGTIFVSKDQKAVKGYSTVFKKVLQRFKDYGKLENIDYDFKSQLFESFLKESISKKNWGQFFTPLKVVRAIGEMAKDEIKEGTSICDPACGVGKFLLEPIVTKLEQFYEVKKNKLIQKVTIHGFDKGFDKDEQKTIILAKANMLIYFSDLIKENSGITEQFSKLFNESFTLKTNSILGTLSEPIEDEYDLILTNPPYVTSGSSNLKDEIKKDGELVNYYKINAMGVEGLFMEWIIRALKPNGKAFVVVPDGIFNRQNDKNLRQFLIDECYIDGIISLPIKTFFTTPKKTYILCITKKANKKDVQKDPVFSYLVSEIGESRDIYRFDILQDDLSEAVALYSFFKGNKNGFAKFNTDKRCKIQPFERFKPENHWSVDRWWSKEEQIDLGILEEENTIDLNGFSELINDVSETLSDFSSLLKEVAEKKKTISEFKEISLTDTNYFELAIGKRVVKKDIVNITGTIPIYSANVKEPVGYHSQSNITNFSNNFVLWGIDGDFEFNAIPKNNPFVSTDHCGTIRIKSDSILPEYLMVQLESVKHKYGFDRGLRASLKNMEVVSIEIPFDKNGNIDEEKQKEIISRHEYISELKSKLSDYKKQINSLNIDIVKQEADVSVEKLTDLFSMNQGNAYYTKKRFIGNGWSGPVPVYSSNTLNEGLLMKVDINKIKPSEIYYQYSLTWTIDGVGAGKIFVRNMDNPKNVKKEEHFFAINNHCGILIPKSTEIDLDYIKFILQPIFYEKVKGYGNKKLGNNQIADIEVPVPINSKGKFDLDVQKRIADKYKKIDEIRKGVNAELNKVLETEIDFTEGS